MMYLTKRNILFQMQNVINEYQSVPWFTEKKCTAIEQLEYVERFDRENTQGHFGFTSGRQTMHIVFRGSDEPRDWWGPKGNFNFEFVTKKVETKCKVSAGFLSAWKDVKPRIVEAIDKHNPKKVIFTGHSRGSAAATIGAENVAFLYPHLIVNGVYFSSPMPGNDYFREAHDRRVAESLMLWVTGDPVVATPPFLCGYRSISKLWSAYGGWYGFPPFINAHYPTLLQKVIEDKY